MKEEKWNNEIFKVGDRVILTMFPIGNFEGVLEDLGEGYSLGFKTNEESVAFLKDADDVKKVGVAK
jgi:hypothetical protein